MCSQSYTVPLVSQFLAQSDNFKAWVVIPIWKSDLSDKTKQEFFQAVTVPMLLYGCTIWTNKTLGEKARWELHKDAACYFESILEASHYKTAVVWPLTSHLTNHPRETSKICYAQL